MLPAIVVTPFSTPLVERFRGDRVLIWINLARSAGSVLIAIVVGSGAPLEATYVLAAVVAGAGSLVRPIQTALLPGLARTPRELVAANVASSTGEAVGTFVGPLLAGILVAAAGSVPTTVLVAAAFAAAGAAVTGVRFEQATDARAGRTDRAARFQVGDVPRVLRRYPSVTELVRRVYEQKKVVGLICHAGLVGISAGIVRGHRATGSKGIKDDLINAGARWVDEPAFRDGPIVWGRVVEDIPAFCRELVSAIETG